MAQLAREDYYSSSFQADEKMGLQSCAETGHFHS